jgi:hypothetical protein
MVHRHHPAYPNKFDTQVLLFRTNIPATSLAADGSTSGGPGNKPASRAFAESLHVPSCHSIN